MAKKIIIVDVEETLEDKVSKYRRRFHIMSFVSLFLVLAFIIHETNSTKKLTLEMNKNINNYDELLDDYIEDTDLDITSNELEDILNNNIITDSNSNTVSNVLSNNTKTTSNQTSKKKVNDLVSTVKSTNVVEKIIETVSPKKESASKVVNNTPKLEETKTYSFENDSWDTIFENKLNYKVGDTKKIIIGDNTYTLVIKNISENNCNLQTKCGFIIEFVDTIYVDSNNIKEYLNNEFYNTLPSDLKNIIINTNTAINSETTTFEKIYINPEDEYITDITSSEKIGVNPIFRIG